MANPPKQKGTSWESLIVKELESRGIRARRRTLSGAQDQGDIELPDLPSIVIEAKNCKAMSLSAWVDEAVKEAQHAKAEIGVVWHHRPRKSRPFEGYVSMDGETFFKLLRKLMPVT
jgi:hypothetical protein